jgi:hypothetical protein
MPPVREGGEAFEALRDAIEAFAADRAPELVAEARAEAVAKARSMLVEAMAQSLLDHAGPHLGRAAPTRPDKARARPGRAAREPAPSRPSRASQPAPPVPDASDEPGYYVYGVASAAGAGLPAGLAGVDPRHEAKLIEEAGLAAIVSRVSLAEFGEEQLHENLNDVEWLEEKARAHEHVLDEALARMTVVPMRLCTIYRSEEQVHEMLRRERDVMADALHRLEGTKEWGVKVIAEPGALERAATAASERSADQPGDLSPGAAYIREKGREARTRERADRIAASWAEDVHERVAAAAAEALLNPLQNPEVSGHRGEMVLNGVYLVRDGDTDAFRDTVGGLADQYRERGVSVELTGPWPPYNFVKSSIEAAR